MTWRCLCLLLISVAACAAAQTKPCPKTAKFDATTNSMKLMDCNELVVSQSTIKTADTEQSKLLASSSGELIAIDPAVLKSQNDFAIWQNEYTKRIFDHQDRYTLFIFIMVNLLVLSGLYFAWIQFKATLNLSQRIRSDSAHVLLKTNTAE